MGVQTWVVVCIYAPTVDQLVDERDEVWTNVNECIERFGKSVKVLFIGDMNGKVGRETLNWVAEKWSALKKVAENRRTLVDV